MSKEQDTFDGLVRRVYGGKSLLNTTLAIVPAFPIFTPEQIAQMKAHEAGVRKKMKTYHPVELTESIRDAIMSFSSEALTRWKTGFHHEYVFGVRGDNHMWFADAADAARFKSLGGA